ncbi:MAG: leucine-rich repeat domain-containing protein, partial [Duncaniella sp.]|nr:leucine-rich repeat domain-containing protein [Duncaniella sp.]
HDINVIYLYDVTFNCASEHFTVRPEIRNNEAEKGDEATLFETLNYKNASAPVLENVTEDSAVRFSLGFSTDNKDILPRVKIGSEVIEPDEEGFYTLNVTDANVTVDIYAVPSNGATLTTNEIVSINATEAVEVTDLALEGDIDSETLATVVNGFESLSSLDLSGMSSEIPAGAFEGKTTLTEVTLPEVETIEPNTFKDCESLQTVTVPETVTAIGEGAFSGCSSLESITLTGIDAIGASAFSGCDNLTTITINPASGSAPAAIKGRSNAPRAAGFDEAAFEGVNPNCLIILGEGVAVPATTAGNYLTTRVGEIPDVNEAGETTTRQGRIYESTGDISLRPGYPFATANRFSMIDGNAISYVAEVSSTANGWNSLVIPFNVDKVTSGSTELVAKTSPEQDSEEADYMVASLDVENNRLALTKGISANVPYLIKQTHSNTTREITFTAADVTVEPTPETISVNGADYSLAATYSNRQLPGETTYVLNADGNAFELVAEEVELDAEGNEEPVVTAVNPWEVYAVSNKGQGRIEIAVAGDDTTTGISDIDATTEGVSVTTDGGNLVIYSDKAVDAAVYYVDGRLVGTITLNPGRNVITELPRGIYIVAGYKVAL